MVDSIWFAQMSEMHLQLARIDIFQKSPLIELVWNSSCEGNRYNEDSREFTRVDCREKLFQMIEAQYVVSGIMSRIEFLNQDI